jgi:hypothetical protein
MGNFYTNTILKDKRFNSKNRVNDLKLREPGTRRLVEAIITGAQAHGIEFMVLTPSAATPVRAYCFRRALQKFKRWQYTIFALHAIL